MKVRVGLVAATLAVAVGCGKTERSDDDSAGSGAAAKGGNAAAGRSATSSGGAPGAGNGGNAAGASGGAGGSPTGGDAGTAGASAGASTSGGGGGAGNAGGTPGLGGNAGVGESGAPNGGAGGEKPLAMLVMFDRSWSMYQCADGTANEQMTACDTGLTRWDVTSAALAQFFQDPGLAGVSVALRFFPDDNPGCTGFPTSGTGFGGAAAFGGAAGLAGAGGSAGSTGGTFGTAGGPPNCSTETCAIPLVDAAMLTADPAPSDAQETKLMAAIAVSAPPGPANPNPNPQTPTSAAVGGAEQWATAYLAAHQGSKVAVILVTDGEPAGCDTNISNIASLARAGNDLGVLTYVIGLSGSNESALNQIAFYGGTTEAFFVADGSTTTADLVATLNQIRAHQK